MSTHSRKSEGGRSLKSTRSTTMIEIIKPPADSRAYRVVILPNGITALLISEHASNQASETVDYPLGRAQIHLEEDEYIVGEAAAALCVGVGSFSDLPEFPGFAHFLEHMVFMGSKKYPKENFWDAFLAKDGGDTNAWTDCERTCFFFTSSHSIFQKALDVFAQFFISPLFRKASVDKEIMAVDNECHMVASHDTERIRSVISHNIVEDGHPMQKFMAGNKKSLKDIPESKNLNVYAQLQAFKTRYYSAHYMTLVLHSPDSLDFMEKYTMKIFSKIPNNGIPRPKFLMPPFKDSKFNKIVRVIPVEDVHKMEIMWSLPPLMEHYRAKVIEFLSLLFGHEGRGSIMSFLRKKNFAIQIGGGNDMSGYTHNSTWTAFVVLVKLTEHGLQNFEQVIDVIFQYIKLLNETLPCHVFEEQQHIEEIKYIFQEQVSLFDYVEQLAESMHMFPPEHYLCGKNLYLEYDEELIKHCLEFLKPSSMLVVLYDKSFSSLSGLLEEPWLGTKYTLQDVDRLQKERFQRVRLNPDLHLPDPNPFIATNFSIVKSRKTTKHPVVVYNEKGARVWFKKDNFFHTPTAFIYINFITTAIRASAQNMVLNDIYLTCLLHELTETLYHATLAGYEYTVEGAPEGIVFMISGYSEKFLLVIQETFRSMHNLEINKESFKYVAAHLKQVYFNDLMKPVELARAIRYSALELDDPSLLERYEQINTLTYPMLQGFVEQLYNSLFVEIFVGGNLKPQDAVDIGHMAKKMGKKCINESDFPVPTMLELPPGQHMCLLPAINKEDTNSCVVQYFQQGLGTYRAVCLNEIIAAVMSEPLFNVLRTEKQMGYSVYCTPMVTHGVVGFLITVETQANKFSMQEVNKALNDFLKSFDKSLSSMPAAKIHDLIDGQQSKMDTEEADMFDESMLIWQEIAKHNYGFDYKSKQVEAVKDICHTDIIEWYKQTITGDQARKFTIMVEGCDKDKCHFASDKADGHGLSRAFIKNLLTCKDAGKGISAGRDNLVKLQDGGINYVTNLCDFKTSLKCLPHHIIKD